MTELLVDVVESIPDGDDDSTEVYAETREIGEDDETDIEDQEDQEDEKNKKEFIQSRCNACHRFHVLRPNSRDAELTRAIHMTQPDTAVLSPKSPSSSDLNDQKQADSKKLESKKLEIELKRFLEYYAKLKQAVKNNNMVAGLKLEPLPNIKKPEAFKRDVLGQGKFKSPKHREAFIEIMQSLLQLMLITIPLNFKAIDSSRRHGDLPYCVQYMRLISVADALHVCANAMKSKQTLAVKSTMLSVSDFLPCGELRDRPAAEHCKEGLLRLASIPDPDHSKAPTEAAIVLELEDKVFGIRLACMRTEKPVVKKSGKLDAAHYQGDATLYTTFMCHYCGEFRSDLKYCGHCKRSRYCSTKCQQNDWPIHRESCIAHSICDREVIDDRKANKKSKKSAVAGAKQTETSEIVD